MKNIRVWCVADTHGFHEDLIIPEEIDWVIHAGDISNTKSPVFNSNECSLFLNWYNKLNIKRKILIAGNHDTSIENKLINPKDYSSIIYIEHETIEIDNYVLFGSPYTPTFGNGWAFNVPRHKIQNYWEEIPKECDILITHGPPKGMLDLSYDDKNIQQVGDKSLYNKVCEIMPIYHIFGHIHNNKDLINHGIKTHKKLNFVNASAVTDEKFEYGLTSNGIILNINK